MSILYENLRQGYPISYDVLQPGGLKHKYLKEEQYKNSKKLEERHRILRKHSEMKMGQEWLPFVMDNILSGLQQNNKASPLRIAEFGSGSALFWQENLARVPAQWNITLTDFSEGMIYDALQNIGPDPRFQYQTVDVQQALPFTANSQDAVLAMHMLYHLDNPESAIKKMMEILKPKGKLIVTTIGSEHLQDYWEFMRSFETETGINVPSWGKDQRNIFPLEGGKKILQKYFSQVDIYPFIDTLVFQDTPNDAKDAVTYVMTKIPEEFKENGKLETSLLRYVQNQLASKKKLEFTTKQGILIGTK